MYSTPRHPNPYYRNDFFGISKEVANAIEGSMFAKIRSENIKQVTTASTVTISFRSATSDKPVESSTMSRSNSFWILSGILLPTLLAFEGGTNLLAPCIRRCCQPLPESFWQLSPSLIFASGMPLANLALANQLRKFLLTKLL